MSFPDIFVTEEYIDGVEEDYTEIQTSQPQVEAVILEPEDPQKCIDDNPDTAKEVDSNSDMTLKQGEPDDQLVDDALFFKPGDPPLAVVMLEKYVNSDITFNRQKVVLHLLETLRLAHRNKDEVGRVIRVLCTLSDDYDPIVRSELMGQFPYIAAFCNENGLNNTIQEFLLPILVTYLKAENSQVRKAAHSALLTIVEQKQIDSETINEKICRLVIYLTDSVHPEDLRTDSVQLMCKLAVLVGKNVTEDLFLHRFFALCVDKSNYVRKACASSIGDISTTVGSETTEELLLPKFIELCKDAAWGVRKACAENFMAVSSVVSRELRCSELTDIYMILLEDQSRWVRVTAYQGLGPFISTFAEPYKTGLYYNEGELVIFDVQKLQDAFLEVFTKPTKSLQNIENSPVIEKTSNSEPCDSKVPLGCSELSLTASEIPSIPCYVGNYSTVIEVNCPTTVTAAPAVEDSIRGSEVESVPPIENGSHCLHDSNRIISKNWMKYDVINHFNPAEDSVSKTSSQWWPESVFKEKYKMKNLNGDCNEIKDKVNSKECEKVQNIIPSQNSLTICGICINSPGENIQNVMPSQNSLTICGICINTSEVLSEPLNYKTIPVVNCVINKNKQIVHENDNNAQEIDSICSSELNNSEDNDHCHRACVHTPSSDVGPVSKPDVTVEQNSDSILTADVKTVHCDQRYVVPSSGSIASFVDESAFNHFQYWRTPIPDIDIELLNSELRNNQDTRIKRSRNNDDNKFKSRKFNTNPRQNLKMVEMKTEENYRISEDKEGEPPPGQNNITAYDQDIVPPELLLCYLNMIDAAWAETAHHCAYSLPAVAITLGRKFWPCLKETFEVLSSDLQGFIMMWKVRRTVASSMHQLAVILGPEITSRDLLPVFSRFIKDLDEVRIGILQHLSEFLKELRAEERKQFLPSLSEFLVSNSDTESKDKNWRFRLILAEQLVSIAGLYEPEDVKVHLVPLSLTLIQDKICEVRLAAVRVMAAVMKKMSQHPTSTLTKEVLSELTEKFIHSPKWFHRQLYVYICQEFIVQNSLPPDQFAEDALPQLLYLCWDRVPNVRIAIARCLAVIIWPLETFSSADSPHRELLLQTIHTLQSDLDVDVQFYANMVSTHECSCLQHGEFTNLGELPV